MTTLKNENKKSINLFRNLFGARLPKQTDNRDEAAHAKNSADLADFARIYR